ncbi:MAG: hypothetical protein KME54_02865 [Tolypothrix brevis GSE-NOS-MK-07-07A]|nr:hypothetical protein [Tolypothrix brevis GSE-NOS-MK-07-07A]
MIDALGEGVTGLQVGDRVSTIPGFSLNQYGVAGEIAVVPALHVAKYPDQLSPAEGTAIWMQYLTAYGSLIEFGKLKQGDVVAITAEQQFTLDCIVEAYQYMESNEQLGKIVVAV